MAGATPQIRGGAPAKLKVTLSERHSLSINQAAEPLGSHRCLSLRTAGLDITIAAPAIAPSRQSARAITIRIAESKAPVPIPTPIRMFRAIE